MVFKISPDKMKGWAKEVQKIKKEWLPEVKEKLQALIDAIPDPLDFNETGEFPEIIEHEGRYIALSKYVPFPGADDLAGVKGKYGIIADLYDDENRARVFHDEAKLAWEKAKQEARKIYERREINEKLLDLSGRINDFTVNYGEHGHENVLRVDARVIARVGRLRKFYENNLKPLIVGQSDKEKSIKAMEEGERELDEAKIIIESIINPQEVEVKTSGFSLGDLQNRFSAPKAKDKRKK